MEHLIRVGIIVLLIALGLVANLVVVAGLWPLCQARASGPGPGFSRAPAPVLDRLLGAATVAALLLALLTGVAQLPVLAFDWCPPEVWGVRGQCYSQNAATNFSWMDAAVACEGQGGVLAGFPLGRFPYHLPNLEKGRFWVGVMDDGIPRPSCRNSAVKGKHPSPKCLKIDEGCPQMVISSAKNVSVVHSACDLQVGYICDLGPMIVVPGFCQVQGLITSFLSPLVLCYLTLISIERFLQYLVPEEHDLTFSWLNTSVIQAGLMFLLVTDATGPVYGWAQYIFSSEGGLCVLDAGSRYVATYIGVSLPLYYFLPLLVTLASHAVVLLQRHSYHEEDEYPFPSRVIPAGRRGQLLLCAGCVLPFLGRLPSVLAVVICASRLGSGRHEADGVDDVCREGKLDFFLVWCKFFSASCLLPLLLLAGSPNLRKQARAFLCDKLGRCACAWRRSADGLDSPIELASTGKQMKGRSPDEEVIEIV